MRARIERPQAALDMLAWGLTESWKDSALDNHTCKIDGCEKPRTRGTSGWCSMHRARWYRTGSTGPAAPVIDRTIRACAVDGCDQRTSDRVYCMLHGTRYRRHGDPLAVKTAVFATGEDHHNWVGDDLTYVAAHHRVYRTKGKASDYACSECGGPARHWAYDHADPEEKWGPSRSHNGLVLAYSASPEHYRPMCVTCHSQFDMTVPYVATREGVVV